MKIILLGYQNVIIVFAALLVMLEHPSQLFDSKIYFQIYIQIIDWIL